MAAVIGTSTQHAFHVETRLAGGDGYEIVVSRCSGCPLAKRERLLNGKVVSVEVKIRDSWPWMDPAELEAVVRHGGVGS